MKNKVKAGLLLIVIVIYFVLMNTVFAGGHFTFGLSDGHHWIDISYEMIEGNANGFSVELKDPHTIKAKYKGNYDVKVVLTLTDDNNETMNYQLRLFERMGNAGGDSTLQVESELIQL